MLVCDEIQSGFGRTGKMFAFEHSGIEPDLVAIAKSVAGGLPLAGVVGKAEMIDSVTPGGLGGTYGGNPLACAAALATLDIFEEEGLVERARTIGARIERALRDMQRRHPKIADVRGLGAMLAFEFVDEPDKPRSTYAARVIEEARKRGLLLMSAGSKADVIRVLVPLVIADDELDTALARLVESCDAALG